MVDVGVYPLTLVTSMFGPARAVRAWGWELKPDRAALDGSTFRIGSPDLIVAAVELADGPVVRLTASFYVGSADASDRHAGVPWRRRLTAAGELPGVRCRGRDGAVRRDLRAAATLVRPGYRGTAWARGVAEMATAIADGRPHRASAEQAAHVVDILAACADSIAADGRAVPIDSTFASHRRSCPGRRQTDGGRSCRTQPLPSGSLKRTNEFHGPPWPSDHAPSAKCWIGPASTPVVDEASAGRRRCRPRRSGCP